MHATWADPDKSAVNFWLDGHSVRPGLSPDDAEVLAFLDKGGVIGNYEPPPPLPTIDEMDFEELTRLLTAQGSPVRALAEAQFQMLNEVRTLQGKQPLTAVQYKTHLKGLMRD